LLGIRFVLGLFGANPAAGFAQFIYGLTGPFIAPFVGLFGQPRFEGSVFEFNSLVAIIVYALIAWVLVKIVWLTMTDSRRGRVTTSSRTDTRSK
jgi:YggT family protein